MIIVPKYFPIQISDWRVHGPLRLEYIKYSKTDFSHDVKIGRSTARGGQTRSVDFPL